MTNMIYGIRELCGEAWENAINETIRVLNLTAKTNLTFQDNWKEAQNTAFCFNVKFDENGNLARFTR